MISVICLSLQDVSSSFCSGGTYSQSKDKSSLTKLTYRCFKLLTSFLKLQFMSVSLALVLSLILMRVSLKLSAESRFCVDIWYDDGGPSFKG